MLKFISQLAVALAGFFIFAHVAGWLMLVFTNPIVFTICVALIGLFALKIAFRGSND
jgi:putative effector of murein hydrolase